VDLVWSNAVSIEIPHTFDCHQSRNVLLCQYITLHYQCRLGKKKYKVARTLENFSINLNLVRLHDFLDCCTNIT
jgi:hypothetical protein